MTVYYCQCRIKKERLSKQEVKALLGSHVSLSLYRVRMLRRILVLLT